MWWNIPKAVLGLSFASFTLLFAFADYPSAGSLLNAGFCLIAVLGVALRSWTIVCAVAGTYIGAALGGSLGSSSMNGPINAILGVIAGVALGVLLTIFETGPDPRRESPKTCVGPARAKSPATFRLKRPDPGLRRRPPFG